MGGPTLTQSRLSVRVYSLSLHCVSDDEGEAQQPAEGFRDAGSAKLTASCGTPHRRALHDGSPVQSRQGIGPEQGSHQCHPTQDTLITSATNIIFYMSNINMPIPMTGTLIMPCTFSPDLRSAGGCLDVGDHGFLDRSDSDSSVDSVAFCQDSTCSVVRTIVCC